MGLVRLIARIFLLKTIIQRLKKEGIEPNQSGPGAAVGVSRPGSKAPPTGTHPPSKSRRPKPEPIPPQGHNGEPETPMDLEPRDWKKAVKNTVKEIKADRVTFIGAGMAYYMFLAVFPGLIAALGILGLANVDTAPIVDTLRTQLPEETGRSLIAIVTGAAEQPRGASLIATIFGIAVALLSATSAFVGLQSGLNIAFDVPEDRKFLAARLTAFGLILATGIVGVLPSLLFALGEGWVFSVLGWIVSAIAIVLLFSVYYYVGPKREKPTWQWVSPGGIVGAIVWIIGSTGFSIYAENFSTYGETYGPVGAFVVLILWLYLTSIAILIGGELNAELERKAEQRTA